LVGGPRSQPGGPQARVRNPEKRRDSRGAKDKPGRATASRTYRQPGQYIGDVVHADKHATESDLERDHGQSQAKPTPAGNDRHGGSGEKTRRLRWKRGVRRVREKRMKVISHERALNEDRHLGYMAGHDDDSKAENDG
jgi:hypothetical protein